MSGRPGIGPSQALRSSAYVLGTHLDGTGLNVLKSSPAASKNTIQSIDVVGAFAVCGSSSCGGTFVNCVRCPAMSVTTSRIFVIVIGGSSKSALHRTDIGSRSRGLVRYQNLYVGT